MKKINRIIMMRIFQLIVLGILVLGKVSSTYAAPELYFDIRRNGGGSFEEDRTSAGIITNDTVEIEVKSAINSANIAQMYICCDGETRKADTLKIESGSIHSLRAYYVDTNGNKSMEYECPFGIMVDKRLPQIELSEQDMGEMLSVYGRVYDEDSGLLGYKVFLEGERICHKSYAKKDNPVKSDSVQFDISYEELEMGENELILELLDLAGNKSSVKWTLVKAAPEEDLAGAEKVAMEKSPMASADKTVISEVTVNPKQVSPVDGQEKAEPEGEYEEVPVISAEPEAYENKIWEKNDSEETVNIVVEEHSITPLNAAGTVQEVSDRGYIRVFLPYCISAAFMLIALLIIVKDYRRDSGNN